jgi:vacuolar-type H+-ATPase subunit D/Vma8
METRAKGKSSQARAEREMRLEETRSEIMRQETRLSMIGQYLELLRSKEASLRDSL